MLTSSSHLAAEGAAEATTVPPAVQGPPSSPGRSAAVKKVTNAMPMFNLPDENWRPVSFVDLNRAGTPDAVLWNQLAAALVLYPHHVMLIGTAVLPRSPMCRERSSARDSSGRTPFKSAQAW